MRSEAAKSFFARASRRSASSDSTRLESAPVAADVPAGTHQTLRVFFFDLLHVDGRDLLDTPLAERMAVMSEVLPPELLVPRTVAERPEQVGDAFAAATSGERPGAEARHVDQGVAAPAAPVLLPV